MTKYYVQVIKDGVSLAYSSKGKPDLELNRCFYISELLEIYFNEFTWQMSLAIKDINNIYVTVYNGSHLFIIEGSTPLNDITQSVLTLAHLFEHNYIEDITTAVERENKLKEVLS